MAINKLVKSALKVLSSTDIDIKKTYKLERRLGGSKIPTKGIVRNLRGSNRILNSKSRKRKTRKSYTFWDHSISVGSHEIPVRIFLPNKNALPGEYSILLFFHGGGWVKGDINSYSKVCTLMAKETQHVVISVDYRLAPEYKFPTAVEDCYMAAQEIFEYAHLLNVDANDITLIGDSAGGNLAAVVSLMAREKGKFLPKKQILIYPSTNNDHSENSPFPSIIENGTDYLLTSKRIRDYMDLYVRSEDDYQNPYFAPLLAKSFENQPETLIITAEFDPLRDEGEYYGKKLKEAGNFVEIYRIADAIHGFIVLPKAFDQVKIAYEHINNFLNKD